jgi:hypothetical protein
MCRTNDSVLDSERLTGEPSHPLVHNLLHELPNNRILPLAGLLSPTSHR